MKQTINIGTATNSGNGDPGRSAFNKVNLNFNEVYGNFQYSETIFRKTLTANTTVATASYFNLFTLLTNANKLPISDTIDILDIAGNNIVTNWLNVKMNHKIRVKFSVTAGATKYIDLQARLQNGTIEYNTQIIRTTTSANHTKELTLVNSESTDLKNDIGFNIGLNNHSAGTFVIPTGTILEVYIKTEYQKILQ